MTCSSSFSRLLSSVFTFIAIIILFLFLMTISPSSSSFKHSSSPLLFVDALQQISTCGKHVLSRGEIVEVDSTAVQICDLLELTSEGQPIKNLTFTPLQILEMTIYIHDCLFEDSESDKGYAIVFMGVLTQLNITINNVRMNLPTSPTAALATGRHLIMFVSGLTKTKALTVTDCQIAGLVPSSSSAKVFPSASSSSRVVFIYAAKSLVGDNAKAKFTFARNTMKNFVLSNDKGGATTVSMLTAASTFQDWFQFVLEDNVIENVKVESTGSYASLYMFSVASVSGNFPTETAGLSVQSNRLNNIEVVSLTASVVGSAALSIWMQVASSSNSKFLGMFLMHNVIMNAKVKAQHAVSLTLAQFSSSVHMSAKFGGTFRVENTTFHNIDLTSTQGDVDLKVMYLKTSLFHAQSVAFKSITMSNIFIICLVGRPAYDVFRCQRSLEYYSGTSFGQSNLLLSLVTVKNLTTRCGGGATGFRGFRGIYIGGIRGVAIDTFEVSHVQLSHLDIQEPQARILVAEFNQGLRMRNALIQNVSIFASKINASLTQGVEVFVIYSLSPLHGLKSLRFLSNNIGRASNISSGAGGVSDQIHIPQSREIYFGFLKLTRDLNAVLDVEEETSFVLQDNSVSCGSPSSPCRTAASTWGDFRMVKLSGDLVNFTSILLQRNVMSEIHSTGDASGFVVMFEVGKEVRLFDQEQLAQNKKKSISFQVLDNVIRHVSLQCGRMCSVKGVYILRGVNPIHEFIVRNFSLHHIHSNASTNVANFYVVHSYLGNMIFPTLDTTSSSSSSSSKKNEIVVQDIHLHSSFFGSSEKQLQLYLVSFQDDTVSSTSSCPSSITFTDCSITNVDIHVHHELDFAMFFASENLRVELLPSTATSRITCSNNLLSHVNVSGGGKSFAEAFSVFQVLYSTSGSSSSSSSSSSWSSSFYDAGLIVENNNITSVNFLDVGKVTLSVFRVGERFNDMTDFTSFLVKKNAISAISFLSCVEAEISISRATGDLNLTMPKYTFPNIDVMYNSIRDVSILKDEASGKSLVEGELTIFRVPKSIEGLETLSVTGNEISNFTSTTQRNTVSHIFRVGSVRTSRAYFSHNRMRRQSFTVGAGLSFCKLIAIPLGMYGSVMEDEDGGAPLAPVVAANGNSISDISVLSKTNFAVYVAYFGNGLNGYDSVFISSNSITNVTTNLTGGGTTQLFVSANILVMNSCIFSSPSSSSSSTPSSSSSSSPRTFSATKNSIRDCFFYNPEGETDVAVFSLGGFTNIDEFKIEDVEISQLKSVATAHYVETMYFGNTLIFNYHQDGSGGVMICNNFRLENSSFTTLDSLVPSLYKDPQVTLQQLVDGGMIFSGGTMFDGVRAFLCSSFSVSNVLVDGGTFTTEAFLTIISIAGPFQLLEQTSSSPSVFSLTNIKMHNNTVVCGGSIISYPLLFRDTVRNIASFTLSDFSVRDSNLTSLSNSIDSGLVVFPEGLVNCSAVQLSSGTITNMYLSSVLRIKFRAFDNLFAPSSSSSSSSSSAKTVSISSNFTIRDVTMSGVSATSQNSSVSVAVAYLACNLTKLDSLVLDAVSVSALKLSGATSANLTAVFFNSSFFGNLSSAFKIENVNLGPSASGSFSAPSIVRSFIFFSASTRVSNVNFSLLDNNFSNTVPIVAFESTTRMDKLPKRNKTVNFYLKDNSFADKVPNLGRIVTTLSTASNSSLNASTDLSAAIRWKLDCNTWSRGYEKAFLQGELTDGVIPDVEALCISFTITRSRSLSGNTPSRSPTRTRSRNTLSLSNSNDTSPTMSANETRSRSQTVHPTSRSAEGSESEPLTLTVSRTVSTSPSPPYNPVIGLDPEVLAAASSTTQTVAGLAALGGAAPTAALAMARSLGVVDLIGCPRYTPQGTRWINEPLRWSWTLTPGFNLGSEPGAHYRAALVFFLVLLPLAAILAFLAPAPFLPIPFRRPRTSSPSSSSSPNSNRRNNRNSSSSSARNEIDESPLLSPAERQQARYEASLAEEARLREEQLDEQRRAQEERKKLDALRPRAPRGSMAPHFILLIFSPVLGSWASAVGALVTTGDKLDVLLAVIPLAVLLFGCFILFRRLSRSVEERKLDDDSAVDDSSSSWIPFSYYLVPSFVSRIDQTVAAKKPQLLAERVLKSEIGRFLFVGDYTWVRDKKADDDPKNSIMVSMPKFFVTLIGPTKMVTAFGDGEIIDTRRHRWAPFYIFANVLGALVLSFFHGFSKGNDNEESACRGAIALSAFVNFGLFILTIYLRPFIIPWRNFCLGFIDATTAAISIWALVLSEKTLTEKDTKEIAALQMLALLGATIPSFLLLASKAGRIALIVTSKCQVVSAQAHFAKMLGSSNADENSNNTNRNNTTGVAQHSWRRAAADSFGNPAVENNDQDESVDLLRGPAAATAAAAASSTTPSPPKKKTTILKRTTRVVKKKDKQQQQEEEEEEERKEEEEAVPSATSAATSAAAAVAGGDELDENQLGPKTNNNKSKSESKNEDERPLIIDQQVGQLEEGEEMKEV